jgi:hypothetical protein
MGRGIFLVGLVTNLFREVMLLLLLLLLVVVGIRLTLITI